MKSVYCKYGSWDSMCSFVTTDQLSVMDYFEARATNFLQTCLVKFLIQSLDVLALQLVNFLIYKSDVNVFIYHLDTERCENVWTFTLLFDDGLFKYRQNC